MNGEISGGKNGIIYERPDPARELENLNLRKKQPMSFSSGDIIFAFSMLVCGFLYWNLIDAASMGIGVTLFTAVLCTASVIYLRISGLHQTKGSLVFLGITVISAANFAWSDAIVIKSLNFIFLSLCFVYWICITAGMRLENKISLYFLSDFLRQLFVIPFCNFTGCFSGIKQVFVKNKKGKSMLSGLLGILLFLPVLILVVTLLTSADAAFESLLDKVQFSVSANVLEYIRDLILGLPVACYLFGLIYGNRYKRNADNITLDSVDEKIMALRIAPEVTVYSALTALNLVYLLFFLSQTTYCFSAFRDSLPQAMTYAGYARRGFFELCAVSGINFAVIALSHLIIKKGKIKILRGETAALCIFTIALIATAMSKMGMYISYYGLTRLRVYTSWFMLMLIFLFILILIRQFKSFNGTRIAAIGFICMFLALCYGNPDGIIAKYNIDRYKAGTLRTLDVYAFSELSDGAIPYIYQQYQVTEDVIIKAKLKNIIKQPPRGYDPEEYSFRDFNFQKFKADQIRQSI